MNQPELQRVLLAAARVDPPSDHVPYAFEQRIMARLRDRSEPDPWILWSRALWRTAAPCLTLTLGLTFWSIVSPQTAVTEETFETALDQTVASAVEVNEDLW